MIEYQAIGVIRSKFSTAAAPDEMKSEESKIIVNEEYAAGLDQIEEYQYLKIIFHLHESGDYNLVGPRRYGGVRGVFACRSPHRPNPVGVTLVKLIAREGNILVVTGLDAIDGSPLLDIKPYAAEIDDPAEKFA